MKSSKFRKDHVSQWKKIIVIDANEMNIFELNSKGRLSTSLGKQKYRRISIYFERLIHDSFKKRDQKNIPAQNQSINLNFNNDNYDDDMLFNDDFDLFDYFDLLKD